MRGVDTCGVGCSNGVTIRDEEEEVGEEEEVVVVVRMLVVIDGLKEEGVEVVVEVERGGDELDEDEETRILRARRTKTVSERLPMRTIRRADVRNSRRKRKEVGSVWSRENDVAVVGREARNGRVREMRRRTGRRRKRRTRKWWRGGKEVDTVLHKRVAWVLMGRVDSERRGEG